MYKINLLPDGSTKSKVDLKKALRFVPVILLAFFISAGYGFFLYQSNQVVTDLFRLQKKVADFQPDLNRLESLKTEKAELEKAATDLEEIAGKRATWSQIIAEINSNIPTDMWLTGLRFYYDRGGLPATGTEPLKPQQQGKKDSNSEELARHGDASRNMNVEKQGQGDGKQEPPVAMPVPNALSIQGESRFVLPIGVFVNKLTRISFFRDVRINDIQENQEKGILLFNLTALVNGGER